jgi:hypothetical protein
MKINDILNENDRREFMKKMGKTAAATAGALALGSIAVPSKAWPSELPQDFNFMDQFLSDKVLNDPKYKEFKSIGEKLLKMMQDLEKQKNQKSDDGSISV